MKPIQQDNNRKVIEHNIVINGTHICIKSVFNGNIPLEKALANITMQKLSESKENDKSQLIYSQGCYTIALRKSLAVVPREVKQ